MRKNKKKRDTLHTFSPAFLFYLLDYSYNSMICFHMKNVTWLNKVYPTIFFSIAMGREEGRGRGRGRESRSTS